MTTSYISCACNRVPHCADWGRNGLVCYGACNAIAIYDPSAGKIGEVTRTLHEHKSRVNVVRWVKSRDNIPETELLSGSVDGTAIIWKRTQDRYEPTSFLNEKEVCTSLNSLYLDHDSSLVAESRNKLRDLLVCIGSTNGEVKLFLRNENNHVRCLQNLTFQRRLPIETCLSYLPNGEHPLLAVALDDFSINLFSQSTPSFVEFKFIKVQVLVGHEDWVRCMDFSYENNGSLLLATGSQDSTIRLWKIFMDEDEPSEDELRQKKHKFEINKINYNVALESVLSGHEGWVYGVHWHPLGEKKLLSCSLDKTMIIWKPDSATGIWSEAVRVGEVGGNSLGFYGCKFDPSGLCVLAHGYQGSFHIWRRSDALRNWLPRPAPSGHFAEVVDLCWDPKGRFLITASTDQTTRVHGCWERESRKTWHEIGRPQVHGYDVACLAMLSPYKFASGAEEKVVRIFVAPETFKNRLAKIADADDFDRSTADRATVPALGLTNKATFAVESQEDNTIESKDEDYIAPTEEELMQNTLWPEVQKLYGHGYEIFCMAARHDGTLLATACRSTSPEHSAIILWSTATWTAVQKLIFHQLTVTQMAFSPNGKYLLSVSRDRKWSLFEDNGSHYEANVASVKQRKLHSRIIWCCAWTNDNLYFATGSREGRIGVWGGTDAENVEQSTLKTYTDTNVSVTALSFAPRSINGQSYILAVGFDSGRIEIRRVTIVVDHGTWESLVAFDSSQAHHLTVKRLAFRPNRNDASNAMQLASCGADHCVKVYDVNVCNVCNV